MKKIKKISKYILNILVIIEALIIGLAPIWNWSWADNIIQTIAVVTAVISTYLLGDKAVSKKKEISLWNAKYVKKK